jgi:hypothetical protein
VAVARLARAAECARESADVLLEGRIHLTAAALEGARGVRIEQEVLLLRAIELFQSLGAVHLEIAAQAALADAYAWGHDQPEAEAAARDRIRELLSGLPPEDRRYR